MSEDRSCYFCFRWCWCQGMSWKSCYHAIHIQIWKSKIHYLCSMLFNPHLYIYVLIELVFKWPCVIEWVYNLTAFFDLVHMVFFKKCHFLCIGQNIQLLHRSVTQPCFHVKCLCLWQHQLHCHCQWPEKETGF